MNSIDENIIKNINIIIESIEENNKLEEYKGLLISKDNEISKLNDINISKENEIKRLNDLIEEIKKGTVTQELEDNFKKEKEQLLSKINNLELKIYNLKEEKEKINKDNNKDINQKEEKEIINIEDNIELKEKKQSINKEDNNIIQKEEKGKIEIENDNNKQKEKKEKKENIITEEDNNNREETLEEENTKKDNRLSYEELMKIKEDIEQKNQELVVEIKLLKDNPNEINNEDSLKKIEELQNKIKEYETGEIIPENTQKKINEIESQISELTEQNKILNEKINVKGKNKKEYETIIFKQENKISELNALMKKKDLEIIKKDNISNKNQVYSVQLLNIINEQKIKIEKIKKQNKEEEKSQISELKREINNLENIIELKESMISNMKKTYKNLQDKYIKMTFSIKRKEQDDLLNQAKILNYQKKERNKLLHPKKNISNIFKKKIIGQTTEDLNNLSDIRYLNVNTSPKNVLNNKTKNKNIENDIKSSNDIILPVIKVNNSEDIKSNNDLTLSGEKSKLEEINEMMKQVIENENNNNDEN